MAARKKKNTKNNQSKKKANKDQEQNPSTQGTTLAQIISQQKPLKEFLQEISEYNEIQLFEFLFSDFFVSLDINSQSFCQENTINKRIQKLIQELNQKDLILNSKFEKDCETFLDYFKDIQQFIITNCIQQILQQEQNFQSLLVIYKTLVSLGELRIRKLWVILCSFTMELIKSLFQHSDFQLILQQKEIYSLIINDFLQQRILDVSPEIRKLILIFYEKFSENNSEQIIQMDKNDFEKIMEQILTSLFDQSLDIRVISIQILINFNQNFFINKNQSFQRVLSESKNQFLYQLISVSSKEKSNYLPILDIYEQLSLFIKEDYLKIGNLSIMHLAWNDNSLGNFLKNKFNFEQDFNKQFTELILFIVDLLSKQENQNNFIQNFDKIISLIVDLNKLKPYTNQIYQNSKKFIEKQEATSSKVSHFKYVFLILSNLIEIDDVDYVAKLMLSEFVQLIEQVQSFGVKIVYCYLSCFFISTKKQTEDFNNQHISILNNILRQAQSEDLVDIIFKIFEYHCNKIPYLFDLLEGNYLTYKYEFNEKIKTVEQSQNMLILLNKIYWIQKIYINKKTLFLDFENINYFAELILKGVITQDIEKYISLCTKIMFCNFNSNLYYLFQKEINLEESLQNYRANYFKLLEIYLKFFDCDFLLNANEKTIFNIKIDVFESLINLFCLTASDKVQKYKFIYLDITESAVKKLIGIVQYIYNIETKVEFFLDKSYQNLVEEKEEESFLEEEQNLEDRKTTQNMSQKKEDNYNKKNYLIYICQKLFYLLNKCQQQTAVSYSWQIISLFLQNSNHLEWFKETINAYLKSLFQESLQEQTNIIFWISFLEGFKTENNQQIAQKISSLYLNVFIKEIQKFQNKQEIKQKLIDFYIKGVILLFKQFIEEKEKYFILEILQKQIIKKQIIIKYQKLAKILYYKVNQAYQDNKANLEQKKSKQIEGFIQTLSQQIVNALDWKSFVQSNEWNQQQNEKEDLHELDSLKKRLVY